MEEKLYTVLSIALHADERRSGPCLAALLHRIETLRSLRGAAMALNLPYSRAWNTIKDAERQLGFPLLHSATGGRHGGGASLTTEAEELLRAYDSFCAELHQTAGALYEKYFRAYSPQEAGEAEPSI